MKKQQIRFYIVVAISFVAIFIYNFLTPLMSDELQFDASMYHSIADIFRAEYENYMTWNGRSVVQLIMRCFLLGPKWLFNICNSVCFVLLTLLIYWNISNKRKSYDLAAYVLVSLFLWQFGVSFDQTVLWESGACNYLWGAVIILGFVTYYRHKIEHMETIKYKIALSFFLFLFGLLGGWCNENTSGGGLLLVLFFTIAYYFQNKKLEPWMITGAGGMITGLLFMVMAPGNRLRGDLLRETEEHGGILAYVGRFLKINTAIYTYLFFMLVIIVLILTFLVLKGKRLGDFYFVILYTAVSIATSYALILTPQPMDRAYFGAGVFMTIACVQAIWYIPKEEIYLNTCKFAGIILFLIGMFFSYCENGANLMRIYREVNEREAYILEQKEQGNVNLTVPMLRPGFETKYSFYYKNDVDQDPESWGCSILRQYYDLESLVGIPRSEWTEY
ncbi:MAG TPA: hypothetical protein DEB74_05855 [Lachnospiraceae bacterium]|nr:hypothetical protein [Lachnospiraceae bacterium]